MRKQLLALAFVAVSFAACSGGNDQTASTPTPVATIAPAATSGVAGRIIGPAGKAQDTVDQLNDLQNSYGQ
jgi:hypothetical protein